MHVYVCARACVLLVYDSILCEDVMVTGRCFVPRHRCCAPSEDWKKGEYGGNRWIYSGNQSKSAYAANLQQATRDGQLYIYSRPLSRANVFITNNIN